MKKLLITSIALLIGAFVLFGQEKSKTEIRADKYFFTYDFIKAIDLYRHAKNLTVSGQRHLASSYQNISNNEQARATYVKLLDLNNGIIAEDYYNYAMLLKSNAQYEESDKWMTQFVAKNPNDLRAISFVKNQPNAQDILVDKKEFQLTKQTLNTAAQEFGTTYYQDKVLFVSSNAQPKMIKRKYNYNGLPYLNMYTAQIKDGQLENPHFFDKSFNAKYHDGPASFSNGSTKMVFTTNNSKDKTSDKVVELQLFFSSLDNNEWTTPVPFVHNNPAYSLSQPQLTEDGNTLYFSSNAPNGYGGYDLYVCTKSAQGEWSKPENLGSTINTEGNEVFPYFEESEKVLFFTSSGHYGLGGLDVFSSEKKGTSWATVINLGAPVNTYSDDFAFIKNNAKKNGFVSSDRKGGSGSDDIYAIAFFSTNRVNKSIEGIVTDADHKPLTGAFVNLFAEDESLIATAIVQKNGAFKFDVETNKKYKLTGDKVSYITATEYANSEGTDSVITVDLLLNLEKATADTSKQTPVAQMNNIYFDYNDAKIRADAAKELDKIVVIMNENPTIQVKIGSHADCRGDANYNMELSKLRAKSSTDYIKARITNPDRISGVGYGETQLVNDCPCKGDEVSTCTQEEQQKNRRTEFVFITN